jgi:hypothetical protein
LLPSIHTSKQAKQTSQANKPSKQAKQTSQANKPSKQAKQTSQANKPSKQAMQTSQANKPSKQAKQTSLKRVSQNVNCRACKECHPNFEEDVRSKFVNVFLPPRT